jgi:hypothetical protein
VTLLTVLGQVQAVTQERNAAWAEIARLKAEHIRELREAWSVAIDIADEYDTFVSGRLAAERDRRYPEVTP